MNSAAESDGWMAKFKLHKPEEIDDLMDADGYKAFCDSE